MSLTQNRVINWLIYQNIISDEEKNFFIIINCVNIFNENDIILCKAILKSGPNKGKTCSNKKVDNGLCKRHSKTN